MAVLVVLSKDGVQGLLNLCALQGVGLSHHHLLLLLGDVRFRQEVPTLNFCRKLDTMLFDSAKTIIMVGDKLQEALTTSASLTFEVSCKVRGHLHLAVILEGCIQERKDVLQGGGSTGSFDVEVLHEFPCCTLQRAKQVQHTLAFAVHQFHLLGIDDDSFSPFLVVRRRAVEDRDVAITGALLVQGSAACARGRRTIRQSSLQGSPGRREALQMSRSNPRM